jgi:hypothetical protein
MYVDLHAVASASEKIVAGQILSQVLSAHRH